MATSPASDPAVDSLSSVLTENFSRIFSELEKIEMRLDTKDLRVSSVPSVSDHHQTIRDSLSDLQKTDGEVDITNIGWISEKDAFDVGLESIGRANAIATEILLESKLFGIEIDNAAAKIDENLKTIDESLAELANG